MKRILWALLIAALLLGIALAEEDYVSDFSQGADGWYARSMGSASVAVTEDGALHITGRSDNWNSPGRDFDLVPGNEYAMSVEVRQADVDSANFMISIAHKIGSNETYENLGSAVVPRNEWTTVKGSLIAGEFDTYVLYVETTDAPMLDFDIRNFSLETTAVGAGAGDSAKASKTQQEYVSDFTEDVDGWYGRSADGTAQVGVNDNGALEITGRSDNWNSPGRDFDMTPGTEYRVSVEVCQDEVDSAGFIISVAHAVGGVESYENLGSGAVKKGEWTTITGSTIAGEYDTYVLYVETSNAPTLDFAIRNFTVSSVAQEAGWSFETYNAGRGEMPSLCMLYEGRFDFGSAFSWRQLLTEESKAFWLNQFNILTPENEFKPDAVIDVNASIALAREDETAVALSFDKVKDYLDFAMANGVKVHGHTLVWHSQTPEAFFHEGYLVNQPLVSREVMLGRLENYISGIMSYLDENYPGVVVSWDVLNEAIDDGTNALRQLNWYNVVGEDYPQRAFELARKYAPEGTLLYYNDYNTAVPGKLEGIVKLLETLMSEGNIDGYGFQMHHDIGYPSMQQITDAVERIAGLGLKLRVSELDITIPDRTEESYLRQAEMYGNIMALLLEHADQVEAVQVWGVTDDASWRAAKCPLLFGADNVPKPAFWAVANAAAD